MNEFKHTPGPWFVHDRWYIGTKGEGIRTHAEVKCCINVPASDSEQHESNARLIAAAPELLHSLIALVNGLSELPAGCPQPLDYTGNPNIWDEARAAIRKALGLEETKQ